MDTPANIRKEFDALHRSVMEAWDSALAGITGHPLLEGLEEDETALLLLEGYRYACDTAMIAFQWYLHADPLAPRFHRANDVFRRGLDNPDVLYLQAVIDPDRPYVVRSRPGSAAEFSFQLWDSTANATVCSLHGKGLSPDADGWYRITVAPEGHHAQGPNVLRQGAERRGDMVLARLTFPDWDPDCDPGAMHIDAAAAPGEIPAVLDVESVRRAMERARDFIAGDMAHWIAFGKTAKDLIPENFITPLRPQQGDAGLVGMQYNSYCIFNLKPDEALVLTLRQSRAGYTGFQMGNLWFQTLDYERQTSLSLKQAARSADGLYRYVISARDSGAANWCDTAGHGRGFMVLRLQDIPEGVELTHDEDGPVSIEKVGLDEVQSRFPEADRANPAIFFPEAERAVLRARQLERRRRHLQRRFGY